MRVREVFDCRSIQAGGSVLILCEPFDGDDWIAETVSVAGVEPDWFGYKGKLNEGSLGPAGGSWQDLGPQGGGPTLHVFIFEGGE